MSKNTSKRATFKFSFKNSSVFNLESEICRTREFDTDKPVTEKVRSADLVLVP